MQGITAMNRRDNRKTARGERLGLILLGCSGGILCGFIGLLLLGVYSLTGERSALENYGGVTLLIAAFVCFGVAAHFMDVSDESARRARRLARKNLNRDNFIE